MRNLHWPEMNLIQHPVPDTQLEGNTHTTETAQIKKSMSEQPRGQLFPKRVATWFALQMI